LDIQHVLSSILDEMRLLFGVAGSSIWLVEDATGDLVCWQATGQGNHELRNGRLEPGEGLAGWTFTMGEPLLVPDAQVDERHSRAIDQLTGLPHRAVLSVPLVSKSDVFGVLQLVDTVPGRFELSELRMAESLASIAAIAIENALLFRAVNQQRGQLRALTVRLGEVQETERQQLAGELHDRIGENLTALSLNLTIIDQLLPANTSPAVHSRIEDSTGILGETARRVRNVMAELRPPMLDDYGLLPALRWVGEQFVTRTGVAVRVDGPRHRIAPATAA
jgi:signal transduction histidine kinase